MTELPSATFSSFLPPGPVAPGELRDMPGAGAAGGVFDPARAVVGGNRREPRFSVRQVLEHTLGELAWKSLPDGSPLVLTAAGMEFLLDDFHGHDPESLRSAHRVLYFASRTPGELRLLWVPEPRGDGEKCLALSMERLQGLITQWAGETFPAGTEAEVMDWATRLWNHAALLLPVSAEKKNPPEAVVQPDSSSRGCGTFAGSPGEEVSRDSSGAGSPLPPPTCSPLLSVGPTPTDSR